jgi:hypothetical protein
MAMSFIRRAKLIAAFRAGLAKAMGDGKNPSFKPQQVSVTSFDGHKFIDGLLAGSVALTDGMWILHAWDDVEAVALSEGALSAWKSAVQAEEFHQTTLFAALEPSGEPDDGPTVAERFREFKQQAYTRLHAAIPGCVAITVNSDGTLRLEGTEVPVAWEPDIAPKAAGTGLTVKVPDPLTGALFDARGKPFALLDNLEVGAYLVVGRGGSGKSVFARNVAAYCKGTYWEVGEPSPTSAPYGIASLNRGLVKLLESPPESKIIVVDSVRIWTQASEKLSREAFSKLVFDLAQYVNNIAQRRKVVLLLVLNPMVEARDVVTSIAEFAENSLPGCFFIQSGDERRRTIDFELWLHNNERDKTSLTLKTT